MRSSLIDNPAIALPLILLFLVFAFYFNRCPRCRKWFSLRRHTRKENRQGVVTRVTTGWSCTSCGAKAKEITGLATASIEEGAPPPLVETLPRGPLWDPRVIWRRFGFKGIAGSFLVLFLSAFIAFDPEVLYYPSHFQSYLESFADFLLGEGSQRRELRTRVRVAGGSWKKTRVVERCEEIIEEGWLQKMPSGAIVLEQSPRGWKPELARQGLTFEMAPVWAKYKRLVWGRDGEISREGGDGIPQNPELVLPRVIEMGVGAKRPGSITGEYRINFQDVGSGEIFRVSSVMLYRISDRQHRLCGISEDMYRALRLATETWKARVTIYAFGGEPDLRIYVEDLLAPPFL